MNPSSEPPHIAILGSGSWGMALAHVLHTAGQPVIVYGIEDLDALWKRLIPHRLPGVKINRDIRITNDLDTVLRDAWLVLVVTPSSVMRQVARDMAASAGLNDAIVCSCAKGVETESLKLLTQVLTEELPAERVKAIMALSGPSFALEVARRQPTTLVVAGPPEPARKVQQALMQEALRIYTSDDMVGVEFGGAFKNVLAIAAGLSDGLGFGHNAKAALITRGLAEMTRMGIKLGAHPYTFSGLSGLGDLVVTCTGEISRNRTFGELLARGHGVEQAIEEIGTTVEGHGMARSVERLSQVHGVDLPIALEVGQVLFKGKSPADAVRDLMQRNPKAELEQEVYYAGS